MSAILSLLLALAIAVTCQAEFKLKTTENMTELKGMKEVADFKQSNHVRVIYFYRKDIPRLSSYLKELQKSAEFLKLYQVKMGFCDCTLRWNSDVKECSQKDVEHNVYTYRSGSSLLSLELQTMFDVNSIMSNILQLVLLREVPILQTPEELKKYLKRHRGQTDVIFGHMKAIGTFDHRVFMEVAYAYSDKLKFAVTTDKKAASLFSDQPVSSYGGSNIWYVWTKVMGKEDDMHFHGTLYKGEINLAALARFAKMLTMPKMFDIPADGLDSPYKDMELDTVKVYYRAANREVAYQNAHLISRHYAGVVAILLVDVDRREEHGIKNYDGPGPAVSFVKKGQYSEMFLNRGFDLPSISEFLMEQMNQMDMAPPPGTAPDMDMEPGDGPQMQDDQNGPKSYPELNIEGVETQDDQIAEAVQDTRKVPMPLARVVALTDKKFPEMIASKPVAAILFYFPFDALSMANLRMFGEAVDMISDDATVGTARVNCYDWTDVCQQQNLTIFPTLRIFENGEKSWDYKGPQDIQAFFATLRILELSPPVHQKDSAGIMSYLNGEDKKITAITNTTVVGLFSESHKEEMEVFNQVAKEARKNNRILFAYTQIADAKKIASQFDANLPAVILSKFDDSVETHVKFTGKFTAENLEQFVSDNKLPKLAVLTPLMFPELRQRGSNFLILFSDGSAVCQEPEEAMREIVKSNQFNNVSFTLMPVPTYTSVGFKVLREYTPDPSVPYISYVSLHKGAVFNYDMVQFDKNGLSRWIEAVEEGSLEPSTVLAEGKWKPVNKGYEFLKIISWEREQEEKERKNNPMQKRPDEDEMDEMAMRFSEGRMEDEEDSEVRKDLHDLSKSRLYNMGQSRMGRQYEMEEQGTKDSRPVGHDEL